MANRAGADAAGFQGFRVRLGTGLVRQSPNASSLAGVAEGSPAGSVNAHMVSSRATLRETVATDGSRLCVEFSAARLAQIGVNPGEPVVIEVRPYTNQDWERDNAGRVYESASEMDAALDEYCALPGAESA